MSGQLALVNGAGGELAAKFAGKFRSQAEQQHAGGSWAEPGGGPDPLADLVAQDLDGEARFVAIDFGAMDQQARRFVDNDEMFVAIENR